MVRRVVTWPAPVLDGASAAVGADHDLKALAELVGDLFDTMYEYGGVGLAAPQIGRLLRVFVMDTTTDREHGVKQAFINPVVVPLPETRSSDVLALAAGLESRVIPGSREVVLPEACLSFPGERDEVSRWDQVMVTAYDLEGWRYGVQHTAVLTGLAAQCAQHEAEHLDGITMATRWGRVRTMLYRNTVTKRGRTR